MSIGVFHWGARCVRCNAIYHFATPIPCQIVGGDDCEMCEDGYKVGWDEGTFCRHCMGHAARMIRYISNWNKPPA